MISARARTEPALSDPAMAATTPAVDETETQLPAITSLADIVTLAEQANEMLLAARIRSHVRLVSLQTGRLQIALTGTAPEKLPGDIARYLSTWTGQRWLVSLSDAGGEKTLAEQQQEADSKLRDDLAATPLVAKILAFFPGAQIDEIKVPTSLATADDALIETDEMTDDEETVP
jgi:DNA polymerase-3 subunit gamma/tau